jgi:nicotinamide riboside kinase
MAIRIAFTGPESSGKTTLSKWLASVYENSIWIEEYARTYLSNLGVTKASPSHFLRIVDESTQQRNANYDNNLVVFDGDLAMLEVWRKWEFPTLPELNNSQDFCDIHFLCMPDIPWEEDELRSLPHLKDRELVFQAIEAQLKKNNANYLILSGSREEKEAIIIASLKNLLK